MPNPKRTRRKPKPAAGLFAEFFHRGETTQLEILNQHPASLSGEIDLLRAGVRRMALALNDTPDPGLEDYRLYLAALGQACTRVARLIQTQADLHSADSALQEALSQSLRSLLNSWELGGRQIEE